MLFLIILLGITAVSWVLAGLCMSTYRHGGLGFLFASTCAVSGLIFLFGAAAVPLSRYDDHQFIAKVEAVRATPRGDAGDSVAWRMKAADLNGEIAERKYDASVFSFWHVAEISTLQPIDTSK